MFLKSSSRIHALYFVDVLSFDPQKFKEDRNTVSEWVENNVFLCSFLSTFISLFINFSRFLLKISNFQVHKPSQICSVQIFLLTFIENISPIRSNRFGKNLVLGMILNICFNPEISVSKILKIFWAKTSVFFPVWVFVNCHNICQCEWCIYFTATIEWIGKDTIS